MKTMDQLIRESREFVCESWGKGEANVVFYAPVTRFDGRTWIHPAWAREAVWSDITLRADRIWRVSGSLWNPLGFRLIWRGLAFSAEIPPAPERMAALAGEGGRQ